MYEESKVYKCKEKKSGRSYCVKIEKFSELDDYYREKVLNRFRFIQNVDHPYSVRMIDAFKDHEAYYMVMERIFDSLSLRDYIKDKSEDGWLSEIEAATIARQLVVYIRCLRNLKIAHRDISPRSIILQFKNEKIACIKIMTYCSATV